MPEQAASPSGSITVTATCKCCNSEFTHTKGATGGRPQTHCSRACAKRFSDKNRSYRVVAANTKLQKQYLNIKTHRRRQAWLHKQFILYAKNLAGMPDGMSDNQLRALTNAHLFRDAEDVTDPNAKMAGGTIKSIYHTFIAYVRVTMGIANPYDKKSVIRKAGLIKEDLDVDQTGTPRSLPKKASSKPKEIAQAPAPKIPFNVVRNAVMELARDDKATLQSIFASLENAGYRDDEISTRLEELHDGQFLLIDDSHPDSDDMSKCHFKWRN